MKPRNVIILNEAKGNVALYHIRVEVSGVPLWTGVYAESVERANRIAEKVYGKGSVRGRPTKVKESVEEAKGPKSVKRGSQKRYKHPMGTDKPEKYMGAGTDVEQYKKPQGIGTKAANVTMKPPANEEVLPDVKTYSPKEIAAHHGVDLESILRELRMGIQVEFEHTKDEALSKEIALDHLLELPDYYTRLEKMERVKEGSLGPEFSRGITNSSTGRGAVPPPTDFDPKELPNPLRPVKRHPGSTAPTKEVYGKVAKSYKDKVRKPNSPVTETRLDELFGSGAKLPYDYDDQITEIDVNDDMSVVVGFDDILNYIPNTEPGVNIGFATVTAEGGYHHGMEREDLGVDRKTLFAIFNTVIEVVQRWAQRNDPDVAYFIAVGPMKKIYKILLPRFIPLEKYNLSKFDASIMGRDMEVYKVVKKGYMSEMVRLPIQTKFNADYEIKDGEKLVGVATVNDGVIEKLMINQDAADEDFKGHALSTTLGTIVRDADLQNANLAMQIVDLEDQEMKRFLERFGFRHTGEGIFKRTAGSIAPPSVIEEK